MARKKEQKMVRVDVDTWDRLSILQGRAQAQGNRMSLTKLIDYLVETQFPEVYHLVKTKNGNSE